MPKLGHGSFFPELLEPRRRIDRALWAVIRTAYITGTSTKKVDDLVKATGLRFGDLEVDGVHATRNLMTAARPHHRQVIAAVDPHDLRPARSQHRAHPVGGA